MPFYKVIDELCIALIRLSASLIAPDESLYIQVDDATESRWPARILPGELIKVAMIKRDKPVGRQKSVEAFFSTDPTTASKELSAQYAQRWDVEINIRDANAFCGFGQDQCQSYRCLVGVNTFRALLAACRSLWFIQQVEQQGKQPIDLLKNRPWYRKKKHSTQLDVQWMFNEMLISQALPPHLRL